MVRILELVEPLKGFLPEVKAPAKNAQTPITERLLITGAVLLIYLLCSQMPLWGIEVKSGQDAFYIMRMILASNKNTLMELGISPIITAGMIMQLLQGARFLDVKLSDEKDRALYNTANKVLALLITVGEAVAYVLAGNYGAVSTLGTVRAVAIMLQLVAAGVIVMLMDDMLQKGWGLGGGINLFIVTNICENIVWGALSPMTLQTASGSMQFEGALVAFFHLLLTEKNKLGALTKAFTRGPEVYNLSNLIATVLVFLVVIYVQGWTNTSTRIQPKAAPGRANQREHPIKLFYTSNMPIILLTAVISQVYFFSQLLYRRYSANPFIRLLGVWAESGGRVRPVWGLSYIISPPGSLTELATEPFHSAFYIAFMLTACALFARLWVDISGSGPGDVLAQIEENKYEVVGERRGKKKFVGSVYTAAALGGMCVAALSIFADLLGAIGSGTGILLAVTIIYDLFEKLQLELKKSGAGGAGGAMEMLTKAVGR